MGQLTPCQSTLAQPWHRLWQPAVRSASWLLYQRRGGEGGGGQTNSGTASGMSVRSVHGPAPKACCVMREREREGMDLKVRGPHGTGMGLTIHIITAKAALIDA